MRLKLTDVQSQSKPAEEFILYNAALNEDSLILIRLIKDFS